MKKGLFAVFLLAGLSAPSFGQSRFSERANIFKVEIGPDIPIAGDLEDVADTGILIGGQWIHQMTPGLGLGGELSFTSYGDKSQGNVETNVDMITLTGLGRFSLRSAGSKEPYVLAGLGMTQTDLDVSVNSGQISSDDDTSPSLLIGGGVDIPFEKFALGLEARFQNYFFEIGNVDGGGALQLLAQLRW
jgi:opacity protein-like surface antigen